MAKNQPKYPEAAEWLAQLTKKINEKVRYMAIKKGDGKTPVYPFDVYSGKLVDVGVVTSIQKYLESLKKKETNALKRLFASHYDPVYKKMEKEISALKPPSQRGTIPQSITAEYNFISNIIKLSKSYINDPKAKDKDRKEALNNLVIILEEIKSFIEVQSQNIASDGARYITSALQSSEEIKKFENLVNFFTDNEVSLDNDCANIDSYMQYAEKCYKQSLTFSDKKILELINQLFEQQTNILNVINNLNGSLKPAQKSIDLLTDNIAVMFRKYTNSLTRLNSTISLFKQLVKPTVKPDSVFIQGILSHKVDPLKLSYKDMKDAVSSIAHYMQAIEKKTPLSPEDSLQLEYLKPILVNLMNEIMKRNQPSQEELQKVQALKEQARDFSLQVIPKKSDPLSLLSKSFRR